MNLPENILDNPAVSLARLITSEGVEIKGKRYYEIAEGSFLEMYFYCEEPIQIMCG